MKKEITSAQHFIEKLYFLSKKWWLFISSLFLFLLLFLVFFEKLPFFHKASLKKIVLLENSYADWQKNPSDQEKYNSLLKAIDRVPAFGEQLQAEIVQRLIYEKNENYRKLRDSLLSRIDKNSCFVDFANISVLISEKKLNEAFQSSLVLKNRLENENNTHLQIYPFTLLRLSFLAKNLNDSEKELQMCSELEKFITEKETSFVSEMKNINQFDLIDYISNRKKNISF